MRGVGQIDGIESMTFRHVEGNEGEKIGVKRGNVAFYGAKLLKRQEEDGLGLHSDCSAEGSSLS
jgi:hypothetical protein